MNSVLDRAGPWRISGWHHRHFLLATLHSPKSVPSVKCHPSPLWGGNGSLSIHGDTQEPKGQKHKPVAREQKPRAWDSRATSSCFPGHQGSDPGPLAPGALSLASHPPLLQHREPVAELDSFLREAPRTQGARVARRPNSSRWSPCTCHSRLEIFLT